MSVSLTPRTRSRRATAAVVTNTTAAARTPPAWLAACALLLPLLAMAVLPFRDNSEPRYANIAYWMAHTNDWITPWFSPGVPFWGKPPLAFWIEALAVKAWGFTEFALRLPSWIAWLATNGVLWASVRRIHGTPVAHATVLVYATCALSSLCAGAVLTDPFLALGTTVALASFAVMVHADPLPPLRGGGKNRLTDSPLPVVGEGLGERVPIFWRYGFFLGLAIGLLAKGPLAVVLCAVPVLVWAGVRRRQGQSTHLARLPWLTGLLLCAALSLPWYVLAELKTPGFLHYFLVGEHFLRFVDPGWAGDQYGFAHRQPPGMIWLFWLLGSFPWGVLLLGLGLTAVWHKPLRQTLRTRLGSVWQHPLLPLWMGAALTAPVLFTPAANILWTYNLPALAGFAVLVALGLNAYAPHTRRLARALTLACAIVPSTVLGLTLAAGVYPDLDKTERGLVYYAQTQPNIPLFYLGKPPFSARFYTHEHVYPLALPELDARLHAQTPFWLAVPTPQLQALQAHLGAVPVYYRNQRYSLLRLPQ